MLFYDVKLNSFPKIKYNCVAAGEHQNASLPAQSNALELCFVDQGAFVCSSKSKVRVCEEGYLYPLVFSEDTKIYSEVDEPVRLFSVCVGVDYTLSVIDADSLSEEDTRTIMKNMLDGNRFLLPCDGLSAAQFDWISAAMKRILACNCGERVGEEALAISLWYDLMCRITRASMNLLVYDMESFPTSAVAYSEMVVSYIVKNYRKKISVTDIADEFGLSPNYLHAIFKQVKGVTIVDYLTTYRLNMARIYIERFGLRAYEAAAAVGIDDPAYFSRLFRKTFGKSISSFKKEG